MADWFVYLLECEDRSLYAGVTTGVERRLAEHRSRGNRAARYTKARGVVGLAYVACVGSRSLALQLEYRLKRLPAAAKRHIAASQPSLEALARRLSLDLPPG